MEKVTGRFNTDRVSSDGGAGLLRETEHRFRVIRRFSECFIVHRTPSYITRSVFSMVGRRVLGLCYGYEDVADHDSFRNDPVAH